MRFKKIVFFSLSLMFVVLSSCIRARADTVINLTVGSEISTGWVVSYYSVSNDTSSILVINNTGAIYSNGLGELELDGSAKDYFELSDDFMSAVCIQNCEVTSLTNSPVGGLGSWTAVQDDEFNPIYTGTYNLLKNVLFGSGSLSSSQLGVLEFFTIGFSILWILFPMIFVFIIIRKVFNL